MYEVLFEFVQPVLPLPCNVCVSVTSELTTSSSGRLRHVES